VAMLECLEYNRGLAVLEVIAALGVGYVTRQAGVLGVLPPWEEPSPVPNSPYRRL
jgi:hypothetical protein